MEGCFLKNVVNITGIIPRNVKLKFELQSINTCSMRAIIQYGWCYEKEKWNSKSGQLKQIPTNHFPPKCNRSHNYSSQWNTPYFYLLEFLWSSQKQIAYLTYMSTAEQPIFQQDNQKIGELVVLGTTTWNFLHVIHWLLKIMLLYVNRLSMADHNLTCRHILPAMFTCNQDFNVTLSQMLWCSKCIASNIEKAENRQLKYHSI